MKSLRKRHLTEREIREIGAKRHLTKYPDIALMTERLARKAAAEPKFRFYRLFWWITHEQTLRCAWERVRANGGAPGVDGVTLQMIERGEGGPAGCAAALAAARRGITVALVQDRPVFGGIGRLTALAVNGRHVYFSMGGTVRRMWLDADETGTFDLSDEIYLRVNGSWTLKPLDFRNDGEDLRVAAGAGGEWLFRAFPPPGHNTAKRYWTCLSEKPCESVSPSDERAKLLKLMAGVAVPGGFEAGKVARDGRWIVAEDTKNFRLVRFRIAGRDTPRKKAK